MSSGPISIHLLGPLRLEMRGRPVPVLSARQREMLVVLALSVGQAVPADTIAVFRRGLHDDQQATPTVSRTGRPISLFATRTDDDKAKTPDQVQSAERNLGLVRPNIYRNTTERDVTLFA